MGLAPAPTRPPFGGELHAFGTSRTSGPVGGLPASGCRDTADRWSSKLAGMLGMAEVLHSSQGATLSWDDNGTFGSGWTTLLHWLRRPKPATGANSNFGYTCPIRLATLCDFVNDGARVNTGVAGATRTSARTQAVMKATMRTFLSRLQASKSWEPTDTAAGELTYGGTTAAVAVAYDAARPRPWRGAKAGPKGYRTMNNAATVTIPLPNDYPGSAVAPLAVLFAGDTATTAGSINSSGTGVAVKSLDISTQQTDPDRTNPLLLRFSGNDIPAGATNVVLTVTGLTGNPARFCGAWIEAAVKPTVLAFNTAKLNPEGTLFPQVTNEDYATQNGWLATVVAEFGSNVKLIDIDSVVGGPLNGTDAALADYIVDTMHQSELGHAEYALMAYCAITGDPYPAFGTSHPLRDLARSARAAVQDISGDFSISAATTVADGGATDLAFDQELRDCSGMRGGSLDATNTIFCVSDGTYVASVEMPFNTASTTGIRQAQVTITRVDGSTEVIGLQGSPANNTNAFFPPAVLGTTPEFEFRVGDQIKASAIVNGAGSSQQVTVGAGMPRFRIGKVRSR